MKANLTFFFIFADLKLTKLPQQSNKNGEKQNEIVLQCYSNAVTGGEGSRLPGSTLRVCLYLVLIHWLLIQLLLIKELN